MSGEGALGACHAAVSHPWFASPPASVRQGGEGVRGDGAASPPASPTFHSYPLQSSFIQSSFHLSDHPSMSHPSNQSMSSPLFNTIPLSTPPVDGAQAEEGAADVTSAAARSNEQSKNTIFKSFQQLPFEGNQCASAPLPGPSMAGAQRSAARADTPRRVLHLFSGPKERPDGLAAALAPLGFTTTELDSGGQRSHVDNLLDDARYAELLASAKSATWDVVVAGIPCSTFSVARFHRPGPPLVRRLPTEGRGLLVPPLHHEHEAEEANMLAARAAAICAAVQASGGVYLVENPIDLSDVVQARKYGLRQQPRHASLWQLSELRELQALTQGHFIHFPQCALGGARPKWTTFLCSPALAAHLEGLGELRCSHSKVEHRRPVRREASGAWSTAILAAYPAALNSAIAIAIAAVFAQSPLPPPCLTILVCGRWVRRRAGCPLQAALWPHQPRLIAPSSQYTATTSTLTTPYPSTTSTSRAKSRCVIQWLSGSVSGGSLGSPVRAPKTAPLQPSPLAEGFR